MRPSTSTAAAIPHRRYRPVAAAGLRGGLYPGEPEACRRDWRQFAPVAAHLGLLLAVFRAYHLEGRAYQVEGRAFQIVALLAALALPIHYLLAHRHKQPFATAVALVGLTWIFGPAAAGAVLLASTLLIGACHLPIAWGARAAIVGGLGLTLAVLRGGPAASLAPAGTWPLIGSIFMFRMMLYLYEIKHAETPPRLADGLGYFFMLPNWCFLHFPVVDYRAYVRGAFAAPVHTLYRSGLRLMTLGTVQLLLYRLVYHELLVGPEEVRGPSGLALHMVGNYLLYLRVAGQFHMAAGIMHLFGHGLPETHHNFLLASSFTDYWRRVNIYWKDFMVRLVFNPVAMRLRRRPRWLSLLAATAAVFLATWALHAYQSYWLRGAWGVGLTDGLFWGILGLLVAVNVQINAAFPARRTPKVAAFSAGRLAVRAVKTLATGATLAVLWSLWSCPSLGAWASMVRRGLS